MNDSPAGVHSRRHFLKIGGIGISLAGFAKSLIAQPAPAQGQLRNMMSGVTPPTAEDYAQRQERARALMSEQSLDGLYVPAGKNLFYFTGVRWWASERAFGAVFSRKRPPAWICPAFELDRATELVPKGEDVRTWEEHENPYAPIAAVMREAGASSGRLGVAPDLRYFELDGLRRAAPALEIASGAPVTEGCRGVKSAKEIAYMELANRITKLAYSHAFLQLREGMTLEEVEGVISNMHEQMGAAGGGWPQFGPGTAFPHGSSVERTLQSGDVIMVDGGCSIEGYNSDVTRTIVFGKPTDRQRRIWEVVRKAQSEALEAARPGVSCESVDAVARKIIEDAGFGPGYSYFLHRLGHGIGLDGHEYPYLVRGSTVKLVPGMTFSDEPSIYVHGEFGVRIEDCFVVTEQGGRLLGGMESLSIEEPFSEEVAPQA